MFTNYTGTIGLYKELIHVDRQKLADNQINFGEPSTKAPGIRVGYPIHH